MEIKPDSQQPRLSDPYEGENEFLAKALVEFIVVVVPDYVFFVCAYIRYLAIRDSGIVRVSACSFTYLSKLGLSYLLVLANCVPILLSYALESDQ